MNLNLQLEIIKHILANLGISVTTQSSDSNGFMRDVFCLAQTVQFEVGEKRVSAPTWASQLVLAESLIRCIICDLSAEGLREFALVFRMDDLPSYGIRLSNGDNDVGSFRHNVTNGVWALASTYIQATVLAGFEQISTLPVAWKPVSDSGELYELLIDFLENGVD